MTTQTINRFLIPALITTCLLLACPGCGGSGNHTYLQGNDATADVVSTSNGFTLALLPASLVDGGRVSDLAARVTESADGTVVEIVAGDATGLKACYCTLAYDEERYHPVSSRATGLLAGDAGELLEFNRLDDPGVVTHGQVLIHWPEHGGFSGDGVLAEITFAAGPATAATRAASTPPTNAGSTSRATVDDDLVLHWDYACEGDYDQNSLVGVSDLTPLGRFYDDAGPFDRASAVSHVDGDGNGMITVSDLTPIGRNFDDRVAGYHVYFTSFANNLPLAGSLTEGLNPVATVEFSGAQGTPGTDRLRFSAALPKAAPNGWAWVRPYHDFGLGTASNTVEVGNGANVENELPVADLSADTTSGYAPLTVLFSAMDSYDPDGSLAAFHWDFAGFSAGWTWLTTDTPGWAEWTFTDPGSYLVTVRVTDDAGAYGFSQTVVNVQEDPNEPPVAVLTLSPGEVREGRTARLYADDSTDPDGEIVLYEFDIEGDGVFDAENLYSRWEHEYEPGTFRPTVRVTDDKGASSMASQTITVADDLNPVAVLHASPMSGQAPLAVTFDAGDSYDPEDELRSPSLSIVSPDPEMSSYGSYYPEDDIEYDEPAERCFYLDGTYECTLKVRDVIGQTDTDTIQVEVDGLVIEEHDVCEVRRGDFVKISMVGGLPALTYTNYEGYGEDCVLNLLFIRATDQTGSEWSTPVKIAEDIGIMAGWNDLLVVEGNPAVSYHSSTYDGIFYTRADDLYGTSWNDPLEIGSEIGMLGGNNALAMVDGRPAIAYCPGSEVCYRRAADTLGDTWQEPVQLSTEQFAGFPLDLAVFDDTPSIAFFTYTRQCHYITLNDPDGLTGFTETLVSDDWLGTTEMCLLEMNGLPTIVCGQDFCQAENTQGSSWQEKATLPIREPPNTRLAWFRDRPVCLGGSDRVMLTFAKDPGGAEWFPSQKIIDSYTISPLSVCVFGDTLAVSCIQCTYDQRDILKFLRIY